MCKSTDSSRWRNLCHEERRRLVEALRERGLHLTAQREAVCEAIMGCPGHVCAEHVLATVAARRPDLGMNKTTVYRALDLLLELGLVSEHKCGDGPAQYEPASRGHHSHLMCHRCGTLHDMDDGLMAALREGLRERHGFYADLEGYPVTGLCSACRER